MSEFRWTLLPLALAITSPVRAGPQDTGTAAFVPAQWKSVLTVRGELTGDSFPDAVLVVQQDDPARRIRNDGLGETILDTNPRRLIVLAGSRSGFRQIASTDRLIPPQGSTESTCLADPLEDGEVKIERGVLQATIHYWMSCGGWGVTNRKYKFRLEQGRFRLIGFDRLNFSRSSGLGDEVSTDYLRGRVKRTTDLIIIGEGTGERPKIQWSRIRPPRIFLENVAIAECDILDPSPSWC